MVKTRMGPMLSPEECASLAGALIQDTADLLRRVKDVRRILCFAPEDARTMLEGLVGSDFEYMPQSDGDLGARMHSVFKWAFQNGYSKVVIIGADSPALPSEWIDEAFVGLDEKDVVLGPTLDGGYYLVGLKSPEPALFENVAWSTESVMATTLDRVTDLGLSLHLLPPWADLDNPGDLGFFRTHIHGLRIAGKAVPAHTAKFLDAL